MALDLGGVGKGYAMDRVAELLRSRGASFGAVISGRSSILFLGEAPPNDPWRVDVVDPTEDDESSVGALFVRSGSISTSSPSEERFVLDGIEYGHILDPRSGRPVRSALRSVTVWTEDALEGDMLSTALFVLGKVEGRPLIEQRLRCSALFLEDDSGSWGGLRKSLVQGQAAGFGTTQA